MTPDAALLIAAQTAIRTSTSSEEIAKAQAILAKISSPQVGSRVLVRTCTLYTDGIIVSIDPDWVVMADPISVIETGETFSAFSTGKWKSAEKYPVGTLVSISRGSIVEIIGIKS